MSEVTAATKSTTGPRPAAWHPDPSGRHQLRWWDGEAWTEQVSDQGAITSDPPVRPAPTAEAEPTAAQLADDETAEPALESADPMGRPRRLPPEERPSTAPAATPSVGPAWRRYVLPGAGMAVVLLSLFWGWHNWSSADQWRERANALNEQIETRASNNDALERSLGSAASRSARLADGQSVLEAFEQATNQTVNGLYSCAGALDAMISEIAGGGDPNAMVDRAQRACGGAVANAEVLQSILAEITE